MNTYNNNLNWRYATKKFEPQERFKRTGNHAAQYRPEI